MLQFTDLNFRPPSRILRQFAAAWLVVLGGMGAWKGNHFLLVVGVIVCLLGLIAPAAIRPIYALATIVAFPFGWMVSRVLLVALYYGGVTPLGFVMRLSGRDRLRLKPEERDSYWTPRKQSDDASTYLRQF